MKKVLNVIIFLLLVSSISFNVYQYLNKTKVDNEEETNAKTKYVIKSDVVSYSEEDLNQVLIKMNATNFASYLSDQIIKKSLDEEELDAVEKEAKDQLKEIEEYYGDELESVIKSNTNYNSKKEYLEVLKVSLALDKRAEKACNKDVDKENCETIRRAEISYKFLIDSNIEFEDENLEDAWNDLIKQYEDYIADSKEEKPTSNKLIEITLDELQKKLANFESFTLVVGQTTCSHCQSFIPKISEVAEENNLTIYLIEIDLLSRSDHDRFREIFDVPATPMTLIIEDGVVVDSLRGDTDKTQIEEFLLK